MDKTPSRKKRARSSHSPDDDGEDKKRGRPRVEKQDESAADRRRTQIRMAQRAYRQRKESTLDELRKRVSDLTNTIELMNKTFVDYTNRLYACNLPPSQLLDLHDVSLEFETLVKDARNPNDESTSEPPEAVHRASISSRGTETLTKKVPQAKNVPSWLDQSVVSSSIKPKLNGCADIGLGYTMFMPENEDVSHNINDMSFPAGSQEVVQSTEYGQFSSEDPFDVLRVQVSDTTSIPNSLSPPLTYSFQETSIARRIHRACVEMAYHVILDPARRPADIERIFRLSLLGRDRVKIAASLKTVLDRGPHEDLDFWESPLIHVGGAGTHYPHRDPYGNLVPRKKLVNVGIIGPQNLALLENAARDKISTELTVELAGYEGEWFDPYDVQGYLEEKGIFIDPSSSFAEADIVEWGHMSNQGSIFSTYADPQTPPLAVSRERSTPLTETQVQKLVSEADADLSQWNDYTNMQLTAVGYSDAQSGSWMNFVQPGQSIINSVPQTSASTNWEGLTMDLSPDTTSIAQSWGSQPHSPGPRRKSVIIDVSKFVKVMTISGVCLGRSPGFRRRDVDRALAISSFDAF